MMGMYGRLDLTPLLAIADICKYFVCAIDWGGLMGASPALINIYRWHIVLARCGTHLNQVTIEWCVRVLVKPATLDS